ncbi:MAG: Crp/Fnr family transcriptional regulator [Planctomycetota bacterium]|jgi:CRP-like cAMP-binding protein
MNDDFDSAADWTGLGLVSLFSGLSAQELAAVAKRCQWRRFTREQQIVHAEDDTENVFFVLEGTVRAEVYSGSGRAVTFRDLGPGEVFGELSAIDHKPRSANVVALNDVTIASISANEFWHLIREYPPIAEATLRRLATLVRSLSDRVVEFSTLAVRNRIHAELLRLARDHLTTDNTALIAPTPTHAEIANRISTHREAVSRELSDLARSGFVERRDGGLFIPDINRLAQLLQALNSE